MSTSTPRELLEKMEKVPLPQKGQRFHHETFCSGAMLTVVRSEALGGRHGTGFVTFTIACDDGREVRQSTRWWGWRSWREDVAEGRLVPAEDCNACLVDADTVPPQRITDCDQCGGKGWIPVPLKP